MTESITRGHALYSGTLWHRRAIPLHSFSRRVTMAWLDLGQLESLGHVTPLLSARHWAPAQVARRDLLGDPAVPAEEAVRAAVEAALGFRPDGPVFALQHLRTWGWCFNPLSVHFACDAAGAPVAEVLSVSNTPWHERHEYVIDRRAGAGEDTAFPKAFHVSPFLPMDLSYRFVSPIPGERLDLRLTAGDAAGEVVFDAGLRAERTALDASGIRRLLRTAPTQGVSFGIYAHALRLRRKGAVVHRHPDRARRGGSGTLNR